MKCLRRFTSRRIPDCWVNCRKRESRRSPDSPSRRSMINRHLLPGERQSSTSATGRRLRCSRPPTGGTLPTAGAGPLVSAPLRRPLGEAVPAIHRTVAPRLKRDLSVPATLGAGHRIHLSGRAIAPPTTTAATAAFAARRPTRLPAVRTASWLILKATTCVILLIFRAEREFSAALDTRKRTIRIGHLTTSLVSFFLVVERETKGWGTSLQFEDEESIQPSLARLSLTCNHCFECKSWVSLPAPPRPVATSWRWPFRSPMRPDSGGAHASRRGRDGRAVSPEGQVGPKRRSGPAPPEPRSWMPGPPRPGRQRYSPSRPYTTWTCTSTSNSPVSIGVPASCARA